MKGSPDLLFKFWDPLHISRTVEARKFKFGTQIGHWGRKRYNAKLGQKGRDEFWDPPFSRTVDARNFKFSTHIGHWRS